MLQSSKAVTLSSMSLLPHHLSFQFRHTVYTIFHVTAATPSIISILPHGPHHISCHCCHTIYHFNFATRSTSYFISLLPHHHLPYRCCHTIFHITVVQRFTPYPVPCRHTISHVAVFTSDNVTLATNKSHVTVSAPSPMSNTQSSHYQTGKCDNYTVINN